MKTAAISTIVSTIALGGVVVLFFQGLDAEPVSNRQVERAEDRSPEIADLKHRIEKLERHIEDLSSYQRAAKAMVEPKSLASPDTNERRDPAETEPGSTRPGKDRTERLRGRTTATLDRLAEEGKIGKLSKAQLKTVEDGLAQARKGMLEAMQAIRNDPANEGLEREARTELMRAEMGEIKTKLEQTLSATIPGTDALVIVEALFSQQRTGRGRRGGRGRRERQDR